MLSSCYDDPHNGLTPHDSERDQVRFDAEFFRSQKIVEADKINIAFDAVNSAPDWANTLLLEAASTVTNLFIQGSFLNG